MKLTPEQEQMVKDAIGDDKDFPKFTADPYVNHRVDMIVLGAPEWEDLTQKDQDLYFEEVAASLDEIES